MRGENTKESERGDKSQVWAAARTELCATLIDLRVLKQQQHFPGPRRPDVQQQSRDRSTPGEPRGAGKVTITIGVIYPASRHNQCARATCALWLSKTVVLSRPPLNDNTLQTYFVYDFILGSSLCDHFSPLTLTPPRLPTRLRARPRRWQGRQQRGRRRPRPRPPRCAARSSLR